MDNIEIKEDHAVLKVSPKTYPLDVVYSAAYVFLDRAFIVLDGEPSEEILVKIKSRNGENLETLGGEFFNELINYADYSKRAADTKQIREMIMQRAIVTNDPGVAGNTEVDEEIDKILEEIEDDEEWIDDPEGIAIPWEEKYGKDADKTKQ